MCTEKADLSWNDIDHDFQYFLRGKDQGRYENESNFKESYFPDLSEEEYYDLTSYFNAAASDFDNLCERVAEKIAPRSGEDLIVMIAAHYALCTNKEIDSKYWSDEHGFLHRSSLMQDFVKNGYNAEEFLTEKINCFKDLKVSAKILAIMIKADRIRQAAGL